MNCVICVIGDSRFFYKFPGFFHVASAILCAVYVIYLILLFILSKKYKAKLAEKLIGFLVGFLIGAIGTILLLIICSYFKFIDNLITIRYIHKVDMQINHHMDYFYANAYIPFLNSKLLNIDIKMFFGVLLGSLFNIAVAHSITKLKKKV